MPVTLKPSRSLASALRWLGVSAALLSGAAVAGPAPYTLTANANGNGSGTNCGTDCQVIQIGRSGQNYYPRTGLYQETLTINMTQASRIVSVTLRDAAYDDFLQLRINEQVVYNDPACWTGDAFCGNTNGGGDRYRSINRDVTSFFRANGSVPLRLRVQTNGRGEGQAYLVFRWNTFACSDNIDNDSDGRTDFPNDTGCTSELDNDENNAQCSDGRDNDGDGLIDFPNDKGCTAADDNKEEEDPGPPLTPCPNCICNADVDGDGENDGENETVNCDQYPQGAQCPLQKQQCTIQNGARTCPSDPNAACVQSAPGQPYMCSRHQCFTRGSNVVTRDDYQQPEPTDSGPRGADGSCLGTLKVFAGQGKRCRKSGTQTAFQNCCKNDMPRLDDTMGEKGGKNQREYKKQASYVEFFKNQCDIQDQETALLSDSNYCVYLGEFCAERWITGCVQRSKSYCCFNSKLAKMIQEQGRAQLPAMGGFGTARNPSCGGFTLEQFQALDFSKIDLSGYYNTFRYETQQNMQQDAQNNARQNTGR